MTPTPRPRWLAAAALLAVLAVATGPARSSTVLRLGNRSLTERAEVVLHGRCVESRSAYTADGRIYTELRFAVDEWIKDGRRIPGGPFYTFRQWGGIVGDRGMAVSGAARFDLGEEVVVFCDRPGGPEELAFTIGLAQGKYTVTADASGERWVHRDLTGLHVLGEGEEEAAPERRRLFPPARTQAREVRRKLDALLGELRGYAR